MNNKSVCVSSKALIKAETVDYDDVNDQQEDARNSLSKFLASTELAYAAKSGAMVPMEL